MFSDAEFHHNTQLRVYAVIVLGFNDTWTLVGILCCLPEKGKKEIEETVEEMKERDREEREQEWKWRNIRNNTPTPRSHYMYMPYEEI